MFRQLQPGEEVAIEGFIVSDQYDWITFAKTELNGWLTVCPYTLTFKVPENWNPVPKKVEVLQKQEEELTRQYLEKKAAIQSQISDLLCLPAPAPTAESDLNDTFGF